MYRIGFSQIIPEFKILKIRLTFPPYFPIKVSEFSNDGVSMG
jgi:hypothetical protein